MRFNNIILNALPNDKVTLKGDFVKRDADKSFNA